MAGINTVTDSYFFPQQNTQGSLQCVWAVLCDLTCQLTTVIWLWRSWVGIAHTQRCSDLNKPVIWRATHFCLHPEIFWLPSHHSVGPFWIWAVFIFPCIHTDLCLCTNTTTVVLTPWSGESMVVFGSERMLPYVHTLAVNALTQTQTCSHSD